MIWKSARKILRHFLWERYTSRGISQNWNLRNFRFRLLMSIAIKQKHRRTKNSDLTLGSHNGKFASTNETNCFLSLLNYWKIVVLSLILNFEKRLLILWSINKTCSTINLIRNNFVMTALRKQSILFFVRTGTSTTL